MASRRMRSFLLLLFSVQGMLMLLAALAAEAGRVPGGSGRQLLQIASLPRFVKVAALSGIDIRCFNDTHLVSNATAYTIRVPGGTTADVNLDVAPNVEGDPKQTFETQGVVGLSALGGDVGFRFESSGSGKCWTDKGGSLPSPLTQSSCASSVGSSLSGIKQLFALEKGSKLPNCTTDTAYQIRSISSVLLGVSSALPGAEYWSALLLCTLDPENNTY